MADSSRDDASTTSYPHFHPLYAAALANPPLPEQGLLSFGRDNMAIPGPSVVPERVLAAMAKPMTDIYSGGLVEVSADVYARLPKVARTTSPVFMAVSNGHGAWQMAINNTMSAGDKVLVLESGRFAVIWGAMASASGVDVEVLPGDDRSPVDAEALRERLAADSGHEIKAVLAVQTDTASGVRNDIAALRAAIDEAGHPALFMVDCIASLGCERYEMDEWGVDVTVGASQKGLMVPPGLGLVWANDRALKAHETAGLRTGYFEWGTRLNAKHHYELYSGTPPVSHLFAMQEALTMIEEQGGVAGAWERHAQLASAVWAAVEAWSTEDGIEFNVIDPRYRSTAVTTVLTGSISGDQLRATTRYQAGLTIGVGIGGFAERSFRIGHMGYVDPPALLGTLATIEASLVAMGAPMSASGAAAAAATIGGYLKAR